MRVGIAFDLKADHAAPADAPDDLYEEFDSPVTVQSIADAMRSAGHTVTELGNGKRLIAALLQSPPDFVFNIAEGVGISRNREARVPAVCEMLGIPYTGSDPLTLAVALDKEMTRRIVSETQVALPKGFVLVKPADSYDGDGSELSATLIENELSLPVIAKPVCEGSSKGIRNRCLIESLEQFGPTVVELWSSYKQAVLVEEFIVGEEVTVGIIGNNPPTVLGAMRVVPKKSTDKFVYSLEVKRNWEELVTYECPPKLPADVLSRLERSALEVYATVGCQDVARIDFRVRDGIPYFIEINPLPGLNPISSDLILISKAMGVSHAELILMIFNAAVARQS